VKRKYGGSILLKTHETEQSVSLMPLASLQIKPNT